MRHYRLDGTEAGGVLPHPFEDSWGEIRRETPVFWGMFGLDAFSCEDCGWTIFDGELHADPPEYGFHSSGCRDPFHCGPCDIREALSELRRELSHYETWGE